MEIKNKQDLINAGTKAEWSDNGVDVLGSFYEYIEANMDKKEFRLVYDLTVNVDGITELGIDLDDYSFYIIEEAEAAHPKFLHDFIEKWLAGYGITEEKGGTYHYEDYLVVFEVEKGLYGVFYDRGFTPASWYSSYWDINGPNTT